MSANKEQPDSASVVVDQHDSATLAGAQASAATDSVSELPAVAPGKFISAPTLPIPARQNAAAPAAATGAVPFKTPEARPGAHARPETPLDLLDDVELDVRIELGRTEMYIQDVLRLGVDSVVELDKLAGDPVDIYVNDQMIARGEVLVLNDNFCVRINDILSPVPELAEDNG